jgi:ACT domain-containing protein
VHQLEAENMLVELRQFRGALVRVPHQLRPVISMPANITTINAVHASRPRATPGYR